MIPDNRVSDMASFPLRLSTGAMGTMALCTALIAIPDAAKAVPSVVPTGVTRYSPENAYSSFIMFSGSDNHTHLIDTNDNEVRQWNQAGFPAKYIVPALGPWPKAIIRL